MASCKSNLSEPLLLCKVGAFIPNSKGSQRTKGEVHVKYMALYLGSAKRSEYLGCAW